MLKTRDDIERLLPHRYPMLLVDCVTDLDPGRGIRALKTISVNEPCYQRMHGGPEARATYAYPASLLIESFCQAAGILLLESGATAYDPTRDVMLFASIARCTFEEDAHPGDTLEHHAHVTKAFRDSAMCGGEIRVGARRIASVPQVVVAFRSLRQPEGTLCEA
jgi:3-hydroxyacyl-[acyl-carrier-protein] dehydratase